MLTHICMLITTNEERVYNLKESKEYTRGFEGRKGKGENSYNDALISKI